jgi:hypothetical protein
MVNAVKKSKYHQNTIIVGGRRNCWEEKIDKSFSDEGTLSSDQKEK